MIGSKVFEYSEIKASSRMALRDNLTKLRDTMLSDIAGLHKDMSTGNYSIYDAYFDSTIDTASATVRLGLECVKLHKEEVTDHVLLFKLIVAPDPITAILYTLRS